MDTDSGIAHEHGLWTPRASVLSVVPYGAQPFDDHASPTCRIERHVMFKGIIVTQNVSERLHSTGDV